MWRLANQVRRYAWGSTEEIPRLLGVEPDGHPQAELWLGAHASAPSEIVAEAEEVPLDAAIVDNPKEMLGEDVIVHFGERLPYLLKLLAVREPLSLQAHPGAARAQVGYAAENAAAVPLDAPHRNYRDPFAKPELVVALDTFHALCGFRSPRDAAADLRGLTADLAAALRADLARPEPGEALRAAMRRLLTLPPVRRADVAALTDELVTQSQQGERHGAASGARSNIAVAVDLARRYPGDPGAVAALLLNHVTLSPGEALFLPAGNVHAYLQGTAFELMGCSDNVLRGGLTPKHVDAEEFLAVVDFAPMDDPTMLSEPRPGGARIDYVPGIPEFALSTIDVAWDDANTASTRDAILQGPVIVFCLSGDISLEDLADTREVFPLAGADALSLRAGESAFVPASRGPVAVSGRGHITVAATGVL